MPIPDPSTFLGQKCGIRLKNGRRVVRKILAIDVTGVTVADEKRGGSRLYQFSEIASVALAQTAK